MNSNTGNIRCRTKKRREADRRTADLRVRGGRMSEDPPENRDSGALDRGGSGSNIAKQWTNKSKQGSELPDDDVDVKSDWVGITIYLPEEMRDDLEIVYQEQSLEAKRSVDLDLEKLRHYYPLVVALGLNIVEDTDTKELAPLLSYLMSKYE